MHDDAALWVVAGCLFEISLPLDPAEGSWRWANVGPEVTHIADHRRQMAQHLRFRAEDGGAASEVELRFKSEGGAARSMVVRIAPEHPGQPSDPKENGRTDTSSASPT